MSTLINQSNPPKCKREECNHLVSKLNRKKNGRIWKTYCCATCQVPTLKGSSKYSYPNSEPKCLNSACQNLTKRRSRKHEGWNKYCSTTCQNITQGPPILSDISKAKISKTVSDIWDVRTDEERLQIFKSSQASQRKKKEYKFASGKIIFVMGNEILALNELLKTYLESDIIAGSDLSLIIKYQKPNGKNGKYYPDIYIPKDNLIIEVKSKWTYRGRPEWLESNRLKQQACLDAGYNFKFMIY
jgi:hypothetical protein